MKYYCKICNYDAKQKSNLDKHLQTKKHIKMLETYNGEAENNIFQCIHCNKIFNHQSSLSRHINHRCGTDNEKRLRDIIKEQKKEINELKSNYDVLKNNFDDLLNKLKIIQPDF